MMHTDAVTTERESEKNFFEEKKNKEAYPVHVARVMTSLYWLYKEEVADSKLNSLLRLIKSLSGKKRAI